jgi:hypothetical protein
MKYVKCYVRTRKSNLFSQTIVTMGVRKVKLTGKSNNNIKYDLEVIEVYINQH